MALPSSFFTEKTVILNTTLSSEQIIEKLRNLVGDPRPYYQREKSELSVVKEWSEKPFAGKIEGFNFEIRLRPDYYRLETKIFPLILFIGKIEGSKVEIFYKRISKECLIACLVILSSFFIYACFKEWTFGVVLCFYLLFFVVSSASDPGSNVEKVVNKLKEALGVELKGHNT